MVAERIWIIARPWKSQRMHRWIQLFSLQPIDRHVVPEGQDSMSEEEPFPYSLFFSATLNYPWMGAINKNIEPMIQTVAHTMLWFTLVNVKRALKTVIATNIIEVYRIRNNYEICCRVIPVIFLWLRTS